MSNIILGGVALALLVFLLHPRMQNWRDWRAVVTPLASIIGSGFLVAGPILSHAAGHWAWLAMLALCGIGYFYGSVIRYNIRHVEPQLSAGASPATRAVERLSELALSAAYFVSVAYYLNLLAAFALRSFNIVDPVWIKAVSSVVIFTIGMVGVTRGLSALERIETLAVGIKLSVIGGLCAAMVFTTVQAMTGGSFAWSEINHTAGIAELQVVLGLVILVQGFETSRYLGEEYDAETRIASMRRAQIISSIIYLGFILLATSYFTGDLPETGGETAIIELLQPVATLVAPLIIVTALASQLSAAVADMNGAGGLIAEESNKWLSVKLGYALTAGAAIAITWFADIYEIIAYASKAFVFYYGLQSLQAALVSSGGTGTGRHRSWHVWLYSFGALLALVIVVFATSAEV